jgi:hypothetical protein
MSNQISQVIIPAPTVKVESGGQVAQKIAFNCLGKSENPKNS